MKFCSSSCLSVPQYLHSQVVHDALHRDMRFPDLHSDSRDLRELEQRGVGNRLSHRLQKVMGRIFYYTLGYPAG